LALQAGATIIAEQANMIDFANKHKMVLLAV